VRGLLDFDLDLRSGQGPFGKYQPSFVFPSPQRGYFLFHLDFLAVKEKKQLCIFYLLFLRIGDYACNNKNVGTGIACITSTKAARRNGDDQ